MISKEIIKQTAQSLDIPVTGVTDALAVENFKTILKKHPSPLWVESNFSEDEMSSLSDPQTFLPGAKSVIVTAQNYLTDENDSPEELCGVIAPYLRRNYYKELRKKIEKLVSRLKKEFGGRFYISVNGRLREKPFAQKAGIGFIGKNSLIINGRFGSAIVLGCIVTDLEIETDLPADGDCGSCSLCAQTCPTKAIAANLPVNTGRCLQYIAGCAAMEAEYIKIWGHRLYGCNTCQDVCPKNRDIPKRKDKPPYGDIGAVQYLPDIIFLTDEEFKAKFKGTQLSSSWLEPSAIIKNALASVANFNSAKAKEILKKFMEYGRPELHGFADFLIKNTDWHLHSPQTHNNK